MIWQSRPVLESGDDHKKFQRKLGAKNGVMLARALGLAYNTEHPVTKVRHGEENFVFRATSIVNWQRRQGTRELGGGVDFTPALFVYVVGIVRSQPFALLSSPWRMYIVPP